jgi:deoxyribodipyrimidine photo-lyase
MWFAAENSKQLGMRGAEHFQKEIAWREFAYHLAYHTPQIETDNWRDEWNAFPWKGDCEDAEKWRQGQTGEPLIDAAMRELYITGKMHNRARMLVASYLTKHLLIDWRIGKEWFEETLIDWDPASNAMGWQWVAGSGPDAAPYFRIFNPQGQAEKFDEKRVYRNSYLNAGCEGSERALSFF